MSQSLVIALSIAGTVAVLLFLFCRCVWVNRREMPPYPHENVMGDE